MCAIRPERNISPPDPRSAALDTNSLNMVICGGLGTNIENSVFVLSPHCTSSDRHLEEPLPSPEAAAQRFFSLASCFLASLPSGIGWQRGHQ